MNLKPFKLERYFAQYEFSARYLLSSSDCDGLALGELLALADSETLHLWEGLRLGYTESLGHPQLREEIAGLYRGISPNDCLVAVPEEGIFLALNAILEAGDHVICTFPGYQSLYEIAKGLGCAVTKWMPQEENGWRFDPGILEQNIRPNTKLIVLNFPHNPTGYLPPRDEYQRMLDIAGEHGIIVFSDEMYRFLEHDPKDRLLSACEMYDRAVSLFGMSKTFGLAGARIGWLATQAKDLYARMATLKDYTTICSSAPGEILSIIALKAKEAIITRHLRRIERNLGLLDSFFEEFSDRFDWVRPKAGTIGFPRLLEDGDADDNGAAHAANATEFCRKVVTEANIMLLPSTVYDYGDQHFRVGFGRENMPEALEKLAEFLRR